MQPNLITVGASNYERFQEYPDRSVYTTNGHTIANPHLLTLGRVVPAAAGDTNVKTRYKHSRVVTDGATGKTGSIIIETNISAPQWVDIAAVTTMHDNHIALGATSNIESLITVQNI